MYPHATIMKLLERLFQSNYTEYEQYRLLPFIRILAKVPTKDTRSLLNQLKSKVDDQMAKRINSVLSLMSLMLTKRVEVSEEPKVTQSGWYEDCNKEWNNVPAGLRPGQSLECLSNDLIDQMIK